MREMMKHQKTVPVDLAKGLIEEACRFYRENGYFHFPVLFGPKFQLMVAEPPSPEAKNDEVPLRAAEEAAEAATLKVYAERKRPSRAGSK